MKLIVVGDVLLDADVHGTADRLSPDGPVPVIDVAETSYRPGGAGLTALLLADAGCDTTLVTVLGDDDGGSRLRSGLQGVRLVAGPSGRPTPVKKRLFADDHVVARMDEHCEVDGVPPVTSEMLEALRSADAIVVSDYGRGLSANAELREALSAVAATVPVVWDPHPKGAAPVAGTAAVTPNVGEACAIAGLPERSSRQAARAAEELLSRWPVQAAVVTLGHGGAAVLDRDTGLPQFIPVSSSASGDTCGAGDRFAGSLAAHLAQSQSIAEAAEAAVAEASQFIAAGGVATLGRKPAAAESEPSLRDRITAIQAEGGTVVATGGCFDLLHAGHARTLAAARRLGDFLVVCLNSDDSVRRLKGETRPIMQQEDRVELLEALECVDAVAVFGEDTPEAILSSLRPDLWVKGGDYDIETLPEAQLMRSWGGQAVTVPFHPARSTSLLAEALQAVG
ncbi:D-glycero-beta-D-manno-heptose 1-phosphate adenylyltransferase [Brevibacterium daeguense]|uniref:D-glycero-beta-D-manno-heptose 1-phosphate adenylyltransferase n=1 Tax=Brevibacterium daeguense TaxID=909936 RepID=A0ABP8EKG7_9MICO